MSNFTLAPHGVCITYPEEEIPLASYGVCVLYQAESNVATGFGAVALVFPWQVLV